MHVNVIGDVGEALHVDVAVARCEVALVVGEMEQVILVLVLLACEADLVSPHFETFSYRVLEFVEGCRSRRCHAVDVTAAMCVLVKCLCGHPEHIELLLRIRGLDVARLLQLDLLDQVPWQHSVNT
eukprot:6492559-Amphidinium_carterae.1